MLRPSIVLIALAALSRVYAAPIGPDTYGESLVRNVLATDTSVSALTLYAVPPKCARSVVVAASEVARLGSPTPEDRLAVLESDTADLLSADASGHAVVVLPLRDVSGDPIGVMEVVLAGSGAEAKARAEAIRDRLHRRISHAANLLDPFPYDPEAARDTVAQQLTEEVLQQHPEIQIFAIHATPPESDYNVIAGSNIGRIGKKADNDDMRCVFTGKPNLEVNSTGKRFEVEIQLHDRAGRVIGAVSVVYGYQAGDDQAALHARAEELRQGLERKIADSASLFASVTPATAGPAQGGAAAAAVLVQRGRTELPGYTGDFDHFAVDLQSDRLFLAAEDHGTLEVFNLHGGKHLRTIKGFETPHSLFVVRKTGRLLVTDGSETIKLLDLVSLAPAGTIRLHPGADSMGYDAQTGHLWIVTGGKDVKMKESWLEELDPVSGKKLGEIHFDADHVEAMALDPASSRLYINITDHNEIAVVDRSKHAVVATWPVREAQQNALAQLDPATHRLFIVTRKPGRMLVLDANSGATVADFAAPGRVDGEIFDAGNQRVYAPGGEGYIGVYQERGADGVVELAHVTSATGAKTAILVPELNRLYVAVSPGDGNPGGAIIWFDVLPAH